MISFETSRSRRVIGRLERGEAIVEGLLGLARRHEVRTGWVSVIGALEWVEIGELDQRTRTYRPARRYDSPCEILSLVGNFSQWEGAPFLFAHVTVSRTHEGQIDVLGGHLVGGSVYSCEVLVDCLDDLDLVRVPDPTTGLALWRGTPGSVVTPARAPARAPSWADAAAASTGPAAQRRAPPSPAEPAFVPPPLPAKKRAVEDPDLDDEPVPAKGDWISHQQFGLCEVLGEDPDGAMLIRLPSGAHKSIRLDYLRVLPARTGDDGRTVFPLEPRRR